MTDEKVDGDGVPTQRMKIKHTLMVPVQFEETVDVPVNASRLEIDAWLEDQVEARRVEPEQLSLMTQADGLVILRSDSDNWVGHPVEKDAFAAIAGDLAPINNDETLLMACVESRERPLTELCRQIVEEHPDLSVAVDYLNTKSGIAWAYADPETSRIEEADFNTSTMSQDDWNALSLKDQMRFARLVSDLVAPACLFDWIEASDRSAPIFQAILSRDSEEMAFPDHAIDEIRSRMEAGFLMNHEPSPTKPAGSAQPSL